MLTYILQPYNVNTSTNNNTKHYRKSWYQAAISWPLNALAGEFLGKYIVYSQNEKKNIGVGCYDQLSKKLDKCAKQFPGININVDAQIVRVKTEDGAELDTLELKMEDHDKVKISDQSYIIHFNGNAQFYEDERVLSNMMVENKSLNCNVVGFDYRNVNRSRGVIRSEDDLVRDGIAQVQRVLDKGVKPENITLYGFSLGGAVASLVAAHFHRQGITLNLYNDRSFSNTTNYAVGLTRRGFDFDRAGYDEPLGWRILGVVLYPIIKAGTYLTNWSMEAASAYISLPMENRSYAVVRSPKSARSHVDSTQEIKTEMAKHPIAKDESGDDRIVSHYASLHESKEVSKERKLLTKDQRPIRKFVVGETGENFPDAHNAKPTQVFKRNASGVSTASLARDFFDFVTSKRRAQENSDKALSSSSSDSEGEGGQKPK